MKRAFGICFIAIMLVFLGAYLCLFFMTEQYQKLCVMNTNDLLLLVTPVDNTSTSPSRTKIENFKISNFQKTLIQLSEDLRKIRLHVRGTKGQTSARQALLQLTKLLEMTNTSTEGLTRKTTPSEHKCDEVFMGTGYGYPMYYEGFKSLNCSHNVSLDKLVTIVVLHRHNHIHDIASFIQSIEQLNKQIKVIVGVPNLTLKDSNYIQNKTSIVFKVVSPTFSEGKAWNYLIKNVRTQYTLIARNITFFSEDVRIDRLVHVIESLNVAVAGGASRDQEGFWKQGCYQSAYQNYSLTYEEGYDESKHECIFCDYMIAPFLIRTETLRKYTFDEDLQLTSTFVDFFLRLSENKEESVVCPDSMYYTYREKISNNPVSWESLSNKYNLYQFKFADEIDIIFNCNTWKGKCEKLAGYAVHPCCIQELTDIVKFIMKLCEDSGIICELHCGTLLGAVKFGKTLPWERDADIRFLTANYSTLFNLKSEITKRYNFWNDSSVSYGIVHVRSANWRVEMYGYDTTDSKILLENGIKPTKLLVDGQWVNGPMNPGLHTRNNYGNEIFAHAQHPSALKKSPKDNYQAGTFSTCKTPGRHDCLDNFSADGNRQFRSPVP